MKRFLGKIFRRRRMNRRNLRSISSDSMSAYCTGTRSASLDSILRNAAEATTMENSTAGRLPEGEKGVMTIIYLN
jgi:hypothetical protein